MAKTSSKGSGRPIPRVEVRLELSPEEGAELLETLQDRFERNMDRHQGLAWSAIQAKLEAHPQKLTSLCAMESTGGEPDVVGYDRSADAYIFYDCSEQSPSGRRHICYDGEGEQERVRRALSQAATPWTSLPPWASTC